MSRLKSVRSQRKFCSTTTCTVSDCALSHRGSVTLIELLNCLLGVDQIENGNHSASRREHRRSSNALPSQISLHSCPSLSSQSSVLHRTVTSITLYSMGLYFTILQSHPTLVYHLTYISHPTVLHGILGISHGFPRVYTYTI